MPEQHITVLVIVGGFACILGAASNWDWFFENWQTKYVTRTLGRPLTRLLYLLLGVGFVVYGLVRIFTVT